MHSNDRIPNDARLPVETLYEGRWLSLRKRGRWEYAERNNPAGAVIILAVTPEDKVLFVEQYRVSILKHTIEMPAGLVGDEAGHHDESALIAAQRELEEETGYRCARVDFVHEGPSRSAPAAAMSTRTSWSTKSPAAKPAPGCSRGRRRGIRSIRSFLPACGSSSTAASTLNPLSPAGRGLG